MADAFSINVDMGNTMALLDQVASKGFESSRVVAQAGAEVAVGAVREKVAQIEPKTGNLARSIYQAFSRDNSGEGFSTYHVSWNAKKAPHGHLVEFGHLSHFKIYKSRKTGEWRLVIRPEMRGKAPPKVGRLRGEARIAALSKHYVRLPVPIRIPARSFVRSAADESGNAILAAMKDRAELELTFRYFR